MNKAILKKSRSKSRKEKKGQKRKHEKKYPLLNKKMKRIKHKSRKSSRYLNEFAEYESSRMDLTTRSHQQVSRIPSDNSVIYVKTYNQRENMPVIDLTKSSHSILYTAVNPKYSSSTSLKLIYKSNNFHNKVPKHLSTSFLTIPMRRSIDKIRNANSISNLSKYSKEKVSILDIPPEFFDEDTDGSDYAFHDISKADLNEEDRSMIECITMQEEVQETAFSLESKQPIENMCRVYGVTSEDIFD